MGGKIAALKMQQDAISERIAEDIVKLYDLGGQFRAAELLPSDVLHHVFYRCAAEMRERDERNERKV
jgi:hypothetical protein